MKYVAPLCSALADVIKACVASDATSRPAATQVCVLECECVSFGECTRLTVNHFWCAFVCARAQALAAVDGIVIPPTSRAGAAAPVPVALHPFLACAGATRLLYNMCVRAVCRWVIYRPVQPLLLLRSSTPLPSFLQCNRCISLQAAGVL